MEKERRVKVLSVIALIVAVLGLTIAFAAMSTTLKINGTAEMNPAEWKIYFNDLKDAEIIGGASEVNAPNIGTDLVSIENINVKLTKPGDTVTYKVDLVNDGDIEAKISNIETPNLSEEAKKIIEFKVKYTSDNKEITVDDILRKHTTENVTITIKFKTDVTEKDLPSGGLEIDLSYKIIYVQSDGQGTEHNGEAPELSPEEKVYEQGEEVSIGEENFYIISDNGDSLTLLSKWNLHLSDPSNPKQASSNSSASTSDTTKYTTVTFAEYDKNHKIDTYYCGYWTNNDSTCTLKSEYGKSYPVDVYDENSKLYQYVENYVKYLKETYNKTSITGRLITYNELIGLGCYKNGTTTSCKTAPDWVYSSGSYWTASAGSNIVVRTVTSSGDLGNKTFNNGTGVRPVITILKSELQ